MKTKIILIIISSFSFFISYATAKDLLPANIKVNKYEAIVKGRILKKKVKKENNYYFTEYKLKPTKWLYSKPELKKQKYLTLQIFGASLPKKGIIITSSVSPQYVPINQEALFLLEKTAKNEKDIFTLSKDGIILNSTTN